MKEHAWTDQGVFNIEGGCYAKAIGLTRATQIKCAHGKVSPVFFSGSPRLRETVQGVGFCSVLQDGMWCFDFFLISFTGALASADNDELDILNQRALAVASQD